MWPSFSPGLTSGTPSKKCFVQKMSFFGDSLTFKVYPRPKPNSFFNGNFRGHWMADFTSGLQWAETDSSVNLISIKRQWISLHFIQIFYIFLCRFYLNPHTQAHIEAVRTRCLTRCCLPFNFWPSLQWLIDYLIIWLRSNLFMPKNVHFEVDVDITFVMMLTLRVSSINLMCKNI